MIVGYIWGLQEEIAAAAGIVIVIPAALASLWKSIKFVSRFVTSIDMFANFAPRLQDVVDQFEPNGETLPERLNRIDQQLELLTNEIPGHDEPAAP